MGMQHELRWVRVKIRRFGMENESDRSIKWFDRQYPSLEAKIRAIVHEEVVPLDRYRQPLDPQAAVDFLCHAAGVVVPAANDMSGIVSLEDGFGGADHTDISSVAEDRDRLRQENTHLRQLLQGFMQRSPSGTQTQPPALPPTDPSRVFLTYFREDYDTVERLYFEIEAAGHAVWWDEDILGGQERESALRQAMTTSTSVLLVLSQEGLQRLDTDPNPDLYHALQLHQNQGGIENRQLIPVRLDDCEVPAVRVDDTRTLLDISCVDLFPEPYWQRGVRKLLKSLDARPVSYGGAPPR